MDYKQKYEQAMLRMNKWVEGSEIIEPKEVAEFIFPELKESMDERIRKSLIGHLMECRNQCRSEVMIGEYAKWIAWLEKQGEQKPADRVEPKFKIGDWVVTSYGKVNQVITVDEDGDGFTLDDDTYFSGSWKDGYHLWTIKDAKDGDVLTVENTVESMIFIYKTVLASHVVSYCKLFNNKFEFFNDVRTCCEGNSKVHPVTKKQYDLFFQKMKEAGYEWDAEKKELKKIEQKSAGWSEEDENRLKVIKEELERFIMFNQYGTPLSIDDIDWLKSLPERFNLQPKQEWSDEDEKGLGDALWAIEQARTTAKDENDMGTLWFAVHWLKSLKKRMKGE